MRTIIKLGKFELEVLDPRDGIWEDDEGEHPGWQFLIEGTDDPDLKSKGFSYNPDIFAHNLKPALYGDLSRCVPSGILKVYWKRTWRKIDILYLTYWRNPVPTPLHYAMKGFARAIEEGVPDDTLEGLRKRWEDVNRQANSQQ